MFRKNFWEREIFPFFSKEIRKEIGGKLHDIIVPEFSTSTWLDRSAMEITLMSATSKYFSFQLATLCGIPWIELQGNLDDWVRIREQTEKLREAMLPEFASKWLPNLLPVLDEFVNAYRGEVNHEFWQRMVKRVDNGMGSGYAEWLSGWISNLYPYLSTGEVNEYMMPWREMMTCRGPDTSHIPNLMSSVPVLWKYYDKTFPLHYHGGYIGMTQNPETLALQPLIGWIVSHDPAKTKHAGVDESSPD